MECLDRQRIDFDLDHPGVLHPDWLATLKSTQSIFAADAGGAAPYSNHSAGNAQAGRQRHRQSGANDCFAAANSNAHCYQHCDVYANAPRNNDTNTHPPTGSLAHACANAHLDARALHFYCNAQLPGPSYSDVRLERRGRHNG